MKVLVDTNVFLEVLLEQEASQEAMSCLEKSDVHEFFLSDFSLHSICLILLRQKAIDTLKKFLEDVVNSGAVTLTNLPLSAFPQLIEAAQKFNLDFDDAYQYTTAKHFMLPILSFDKHFDKTPEGRLAPREI